MCEFCRIISGEAKGRILYQDESSVAFFPLNPATIGHTLVVPRVHVADLFEISRESYKALSFATLSVAHAIRRALHPEGMNVINSAGRAATQSVFHLHVHLVPRWAGDGMELKWPDVEKSPLFDVDEVAQRIITELSV
jgi:histidine triad (HIT) family protein